MAGSINYNSVVDITKKPSTASSPTCRVCGKKFVSFQARDVHEAKHQRKLKKRGFTANFSYNKKTGENKFSGIGLLDY